MTDYATLLSKRTCALKPSGIRKFFDILDEMKDVTSLTVGQPRFRYAVAYTGGGVYVRSRTDRRIIPATAVCSSSDGEIAEYQKRRFGADI